MSSEETAPPSAQSVTQRLMSCVDLESAAVVTILFGLFQVMLAVPLAYIGPADMPKFFVLPLLIGILIVAGGSLAMANERSPSRYLLQGCACSNVVSLLGALIALGLYCKGIGSLQWQAECQNNLHISSSECALHYVSQYSLALLILLIFYDAGAIILNSILSALSLKELKTS